MIKMTLGEVVVADRTLKQLDDLALPYSLTKAIDSVVRKTSPENAYFEKHRQALFEELGEDRDATPAELASNFPARVTEIKRQHVDEFQRRLAELEALPIELDVAPIDLDPHADKLTLTRRQLETIRPLVK